MTRIVVSHLLLDVCLMSKPSQNSGTGHLSSPLCILQAVSLHPSTSNGRKYTQLLQQCLGCKRLKVCFFLCYVSITISWRDRQTSNSQAFCSHASHEKTGVALCSTYYHPRAAISASILSCTCPGLLPTPFPHCSVDLTITIYIFIFCTYRTPTSERNHLLGLCLSSWVKIMVIICSGIRFLMITPLSCSTLHSRIKYS